MLHGFFERWFIPYQLADATGNKTGLLTGYYEPLLRGSRERRAPYLFPAYGIPGDLLQIDLSTLYPELARHRLRGRVVGNKVMPYYSRADIDAGLSTLVGREILWVDDPVALFFLHIQGSGKVVLNDSTRVRLAYAEQNGHPYKAIGKVLIDRGELKREAVTLQSIRAWLERNPAKAADLMQQNASYVFFEEQPDSANGPKGAQGVALTTGHSIAVDPDAIGLGTPVYLEARSPLDGATLNRLTIAQDTGGAIRGAVRADLFLGNGDSAEALAGRMKQPLRAWVLLPKSVKP